MNYTLYAHICPGGKIYIGITNRTTTLRWGNGCNYQSNKHFNNAIKKYKWENISHIIVKENLEAKEAYALEIELIAKYKSNNPDYGYNQSLGGESGFTGYKHTEESKKKMSQSKIGKIYSEQYRKNMSDVKKGIPNTKCRKAILQYDLEDNFIKEWESIKQAQLELNVNNLSKVCNGKSKTASNFKWRYK